LLQQACTEIVPNLLPWQANPRGRWDALNSVRPTGGEVAACTISPVAQSYLKDRMLRHCGKRGAGTLVRVAW